MSHATHLYLDHAQEPDPDERGRYWAARFAGRKAVLFFFSSPSFFVLLNTVQERYIGEIGF